MGQRTDDSFELLVQAVSRTPRPLALLGAGTSVDSGYPTWNGLLCKLSSLAANKTSPKHRTYLTSLNDPAWEAEEYRRILGKHVFHDFLAGEFAPRGEIGPVLHAITQLSFRHILTTNFDNCIERAYREASEQIKVVDWAEDEDMRDFFLDLSRQGVVPYLVYLHGRYYDAESLVLTESSYVARYLRSDDARRKLFAILITQPVVFIGFSVNDPDLNYIMREVNARLGTGSPQHFALVGYEVEDQRELFGNRFRGKFGIEPVFYRITTEQDGKSHWNLVERLRELYTRVSGTPFPALGEPEEEQARYTTRELGPERFVRAPAPAPSAEPVAPGAAPAVASTGSAPAPHRIVDPLDPQKSQWGGEPVRNGRRLRAEAVREQSVREFGDHGEVKAFCVFHLVVEATEDAAPLEGDVVFHLHDSFPVPLYKQAVVDGQARLENIIAYGAFTIGAEADDGATRLELDLGADESFPTWFRNR